MKKKILITVMLCGILLNGYVLSAQNEYLHFSHITTKDGLPGNIVYNIFQDRTGFLWFGTYNGLTQYDGYNFKTYQHEPDDPNSLPTGILTAITEDVFGNLWISSENGGLLKYDTSHRSFRKYNFDAKGISPAEEDTIDKMVSDNTGYLWIITRHKVLERFNCKTAQIKIYNYSKKGFRTTELQRVPLLKDHKGNIWAGIEKYNPEKDAFNEPGLAVKDIETIEKWQSCCLVDDDSGDLWIGGYQGMIKFNVLKNTISKYPDKNGRPLYIYDIVFDRKTKLIWANTQNRGLYSLNPSNCRMIHYTHDYYDSYTINHNQVHALFCDNENNLWIGAEHGLDKLSSLSQNFKQYRIDISGKKGISQPILRAMYIDNEDVLWIGTRGGGLNKVILKPKTLFKQYLLDPWKGKSYGNHFVNSISGFGPDRLLIGTATGLYFFNKKTERIEKHIGITSAKDPYTIDIASGIWCTLEDTGNYIWIGTQKKGLFLYHVPTGKLIPFDTKTIKNEHRVQYAGWFIFKDRHSDIWGCTHKGIYKICRKKNDSGIYIKEYTENQADQHSFKGFESWYIYEDKEGIFWIATLGGGVNRFDPATGIFDRYTIKNGLSSNEVSGILEDNHNRLWISTVKGLCVFDKKKCRVINTYYETDGLQGDDFGFKICYKSKDGEMFFGGQNGFNSFMPDQIAAATAAPNVAITAFKQYYKDRTTDLLKKASLVLNNDENSISFEFATLDFTNPGKNQFSYYMEGLDKSWSPPGYNHIANYNYLPPGKYVFHVVGINRANVWSNPLSFNIEVKPPFWQRAWFILSVTLVFAALVGISLYAFFRQQREKRKRLESDLTALRAQLNPHFIFNSLSSLQHFITEHKELLALDYLSKFATLIRMILNNSRHAFITVAQELKFLELYTYMESVRFKSKISFIVSVEKDMDVDMLKIPPMVIQPLIENSIKHGLIGLNQVGEVNIFFRADKNFIHCIVEDNGVGLVKAEENKQQRFIDFPSLSTSLISERIENLQDKHGRKGSLKLYNIENDGRRTGVRAELIIPKDLNIN